MRSAHRFFRYLTRFILPFCCSLIGALAQNREILAEYKIAFIGQSDNMARYQAAYLGARDAALELSHEHSIDVEIIELTPNKGQNETQVTALAHAFAESTDGIILSPAFDEALLPSLEYARATKQMVVFFENAYESWKPDYQILADEFQVGRLLGKRILRILPSGARVAILNSNTGEPALENRLDGVRSTLGYRRIETIVETDPDYNAAVFAIQQTEEQDRNDLITGWVFLGDWAMQGFPAFPWQPKEKPAVAVETSPTSFLFMDQGYLDSMVTHPYYDWGYKSMQKMVHQLFLNKAPDEAEELSQPIIVDHTNLRQQKQNWKRWLQ